MANERKLLALTDAQLRALKSLIRTEIVRTRPKKPKKKWLVPGGGGITGGVTLSLAKMVTTAPKASWTGCNAPNAITMGAGQCQLYMVDGEGSIKIAEKPTDLNAEQSAQWDRVYKPTVYNPDSRVDLRNGALVNIAAARFGKASLPSGGGTTGGGGGEEVPPDVVPGEEITLTEGETLYIATYARAIDYLAALEGFGAKKVLAVDTGGACTDIKWLGEECPTP